MTLDIIPIGAPMPLKLGSVNCYLIKIESGFLLVDSGAPSGRTYVEKELERQGYHPGSLSLIVLTHGDFDNIGNAASFRKKYRTHILVTEDHSRHILVYGIP